MANEYSERYGCPFEPLMMCDDIERFRGSTPHKVVESQTSSVVYSGSLGYGRWNSLLDLCAAADLLRAEGRKIVVTAFASSVPPEALNVLDQIPNLQILPPPTHEELPGILKGADILFLPETFEKEKAASIKLSISTKAHLYMMSERPVLVYAPSVTGIAEYAQSEGWAYVVDRKDAGVLADAVRRLLTDGALARQLVQRGSEVARNNHDQRAVRGRLMGGLQKLAVPIST